MAGIEEMGLEQQLKRSEEEDSLQELVLELCNKIGVTDLNALMRRINNLLKDEDKLLRLEVYGVDNWSGYEEAINDAWGEFE